ncbi:cytoskeletal protein RodZ [Nonomuraea polychroma]|uniref:Cytoskeletal protein RodZ n=1 Tax=Nonomuraea polychroma TaxID=46176 RepID=A0A438LX61_9ACTN|nr:helix-turn-helix domain-containing protein [Nonomuraea polychroma]RVX38086.1 cytoskeletal protein RodZ [Nonomuraea polychroma]
MQEQSIGAMLAAARQSAGLTVAQVSAATRIREAIIHDLEQDDYDQCGGKFYARGHVKAVAKAVGLDPEAVVHLYDQQQGGAPRPVRAAAVFQTDKKVHVPERRGPNWTMALGVALAIVVAFGMMRVLGGTGDQAQTPGVRQVSARPTVPPNTPITETPKSSRKVSGKRMVTVQIRAKRTSYVNLHDAKGRRLFSGTLQAGRVSTWRTPEKVNLVLSDAGAVSVLVNGEQVTGLGGRGEAVQRSFEAPKKQTRQRAR